MAMKTIYYTHGAVSLQILKFLSTVVVIIVVIRHDAAFSPKPMSDRVPMNHFPQHNTERKRDQSSPKRKTKERMQNAKASARSMVNIYRSSAAFLQATPLSSGVQQTFLPSTQAKRKLYTAFGSA